MRELPPRSVARRLLTAAAVALLAAALGPARAGAAIRTVTVGPTASPPAALDSGDIVGVEQQAGGAPLRVYAKPRGRGELQVRELTSAAASAGVIPLAGGRAVIASTEDGAVRLRTRRPDGTIVPDTVRDADGAVIPPGSLPGTVTTFPVATSPGGGRVLLRVDGPPEDLLLVRGAGEEWRLVPFPPTWTPSAFLRSDLAVTDTGRVVFAGATGTRVLAHVLAPGGAWSAAQDLDAPVRFGVGSPFSDDLQLTALPDGGAAAGWSARDGADRHRVAAAELPAGGGAFTTATEVAPALDQTELRLEHDTASDVLLGIATAPAREAFTYDLFTGRPAAGLTRELAGGRIERVEPAGDAVLSQPREDLMPRFARSRRGPGGAVELLPAGTFPLDRVLSDGTFVSPLFRSPVTTTTIRADLLTRPRGIDTFPVGATLGCRLDGAVLAEPAGTRLGAIVRPELAGDVAAFTVTGGLWRVFDLPFDASAATMVLAATGDAVVWSPSGADTQLVLSTGAVTDGRPLGTGVGCPGVLPGVWLRATATEVGDVRVQAACQRFDGCAGVLAVTLPPLGLPLGVRTLKLAPGGQTTVVFRMPAHLRPRILRGAVVPRVTAISPTGSVLGSVRVETSG